MVCVNIKVFFFDACFADLRTSQFVTFTLYKKYYDGDEMTWCFDTLYGHTRICFRKNRRKIG